MDARLLVPPKSKIEESMVVIDHMEEEKAPIVASTTFTKVASEGVTIIDCSLGFMPPGAKSSTMHSNHWESLVSYCKLNEVWMSKCTNNGYRS